MKTTILSAIDVSIVRRRSHRGVLRAGGLALPCAIGRGGIAIDKREGDGATPAGTWPLRHLFYRRDRYGVPRTGLPATSIKPEDGWCDAPGDKFYNRLISLPWPTSAETMWRADSLYDLVVVIGYNDSPAVPGRGSAIFMHLASPGYGPTEGCVALAPRDLLTVLERCGPQTVMRIGQH